MMRSDLVEFMKKNKIIAVLRGIEGQAGLDLVNTLYEFGVKIIEITVETEAGMDLLEAACYYFDKEVEQNKVVIGAGTVLEASNALAAVKKKAQFLVSPCYSDTIVEIANHSNVVMIPGAFTPTEVYRAKRKRVDFIKIFPINVLKSSYIKSIQGPFGKIPILVTGGVTLDNFSEYLEEGAQLVGIGADLVQSPESVQGRGFFTLKDRLASALKKVELLNKKLEIDDNVVIFNRKSKESEESKKTSEKDEYGDS